MSNRIVVIKLISSEEIIAEEYVGVFDGAEGIRYGKPRVLQIHQIELESEYQATLVPWMIGAPDAIVPIYDHCIASKIEAPADVEKSYLQTISGLQIVSSLKG